MNIKKKLIIIYLLLTNPLLFAPAITFDKPGNYRLGGNLTFSPGAGPDQAINITSSDVTLDLNNQVVSQGNTTATIDGINIAAGLSNVIIQNGKIRNFTNNGLTIQTTCSTIQIQNIAFESCKVRGLSTTSLTLGIINNCIFNGCCGGATGDIALNLTSSNDVSIANCIFTQNNNTSNTLTMLNLSTCNNCDISNCNISDNSDSVFNGINLGTNNNTQIQNCMIRNNTSTSANAALTSTMILMTTGNSNLIKNTTIDQCTSNAGNLTGINANIDNLDIISNCIVMNSSAGAIFIGYSASGTDDHFLDCVAIANAANGGNATAFLLNGAASAQIMRGNGSDNSSTAVAQGLLIQNNSTKSFIYNCVFSNNIGTNAASSHGINVTSATDSTFSKNVATFNGGSGSLAQQLVGIPATNQQQILSTGSMNSLTVPWTNIAIAPNA